MSEMIRAVVSDEVAAAVRAQAAKEKRTLSGFVRKVIEEAVSGVKAK